MTFVFLLLAACVDSSENTNDSSDVANTDVASVSSPFDETEPTDDGSGNNSSGCALFSENDFGRVYYLQQRSVQSSQVYYGSEVIMEDGLIVNDGELYADIDTISFTYTDELGRTVVVDAVYSGDD